MKLVRSTIVLVISTLSILPFPIAARGQGAVEVIERADCLEEAGDFAGAISLYLGALKGNEAAVLWRLSRAFSDQGEVASRDRQLQLYDLAVDYGRRAIRSDPMDSQGHAFLAAALGKKALFVEGKDAVELSKEIQAEAERAITIDPNNFVAFIVLGIWNREIANLNVIERALAKVFYGGASEGIHGGVGREAAEGGRTPP